MIGMLGVDAMLLPDGPTFRVVEDEGSRGGGGWYCRNEPELSRNDVIVIDNNRLRIIAIEPRGRAPGTHRKLLVVGAARTLADGSLCMCRARLRHDIVCVCPAP